MNAKLIVLSAALLASTAPVNARVTGFYVGIQGGIDLAQFKIHDGTGHTGGIMTHSAPEGSSYLAKEENGRGQALVNPATQVQGADLDDPDLRFVFANVPATVTINGSSALVGSDDFEATPEYIYKVRPAGEIFVGYNYQVGSNFVVGLEIKGGMTFGAHKFDGSALVPELPCYKADKTTGKETLIASSDPEDKEYFSGNYRKTTFELETKFTGDLSLRLGCVIPGTEGRLAVFLRGGVGLARQELTFSQAGGPLYYEAIANTGLKDCSAQTYKEFNKFNANTSWTNSEEAARATTASFMRDSYYLAWGMKKIYGSYDMSGTNTATIQAAFDKLVHNEGNGDADIAKAWLQNAADYLVENLVTNSYKLSDIAEKKLGDSKGEETKNRFTWHAGIDGEYHFANGLFVRASYTFKYIKGFFAENRVNVSSLTREENKAIAKAAILDDDLTNDFLSNVKASDGYWIQPRDSESGANYEKVQSLLADKFAEAYNNVPAVLDAGSLNYKMGTNEKSFSHNFSFGLGFKFF